MCNCPGSDERKVTIKLREGSGVYHLACYPHNRAENANDCRFCAPALQRSDLQGYAVSVVEETADGGMKVRLARAYGSKLLGKLAIKRPPRRPIRA